MATVKRPAATRRAGLRRARVLPARSGGVRAARRRRRLGLVRITLTVLTVVRVVRAFALAFARRGRRRVRGLTFTSAFARRLPPRRFGLLAIVTFSRRPVSIVRSVRASNSLRSRWLARHQPCSAPAGSAWRIRSRLRALKPFRSSHTRASRSVHSCALNSTAWIASREAPRGRPTMKRMLCTVTSIATVRCYRTAAAARTSPRRTMRRATGCCSPCARSRPACPDRP